MPKLIIHEPGVEAGIFFEVAFPSARYPASNNASNNGSLRPFDVSALALVDNCNVPEMPDGGQRVPTASSSNSSSSAQPSGAGVVEFDAIHSAEGAPFLWEQIALSLDPVELHEVTRVVGAVLVQSCEDVYAELRALREILSDYSGETDAMIKAASQSGLSTVTAGLLELELASLVDQLRQRATEAGVPENSLFPSSQPTHHKLLSSMMGDAGSIPTHRERVSIERLSLRDLRLSNSRPGSASRPSTASRAGAASRPTTGSASSRPRTSCGVGKHAQILSLDDGADSCSGGCLQGASSRSPSSAGSRPQTATSNASSGGSFAAEALEGGRRGRGGVGRERRWRWWW